MKYKLKQSNYNGSALYKVLLNRGITDPQHYLNTTDNDIINPEIIKNVPEAAKKLVYHIAKGHDIFVNVDADCDGFTSAAFFINWMFRNFPGFTLNHVKWGFHLDKGHGLLMNQILADKPQLVVCPDAGSDEYPLHQILSENNIDLIIIDHHNADHYSEYATVINNQLDQNYSNKTLSGVGMVYKFCSYLDKLLTTDNANSLLDIAALGIIADVMLLTELETRHIIDKGINNIENPFIKAMIAKNEYSFKDGITPTSIAWYIAPAVNAITRMGTIPEKQTLFNALLEFKAYDQIPSTKRGHSVGEMETYVEQAVRVCSNVKRRQDKLRDEEFFNIIELIDSQHLLENKILVVRLENSTELSRSITGLIANKLMSTYNRPVLLLNKQEDNTWAGSARNNPNNGLPSIQNFVRESELAIYASGHDNACGVAFLDKNLKDFIKYANQKLANINFESCYDVDLEYLPQKIDTNDILELADASWIWGQGVEEPLVALKKVTVTPENIQLFGGSTLKFTLPDNLSAVKFKSSQEEYEKLIPEDGMATSLNIIGTCVRNTWWDNGPEIIIKDYEILGTEWYF